jgi:hypothetical protein
MVILPSNQVRKPYLWNLSIITNNTQKRSLDDEVDFSFDDVFIASLSRIFEYSLLSIHGMLVGLITSLLLLLILELDSIMENLWMIAKEYQDEASPYDNITPYAIVCLVL